jgi:hypothetical protein
VKGRKFMFITLIILGILILLLLFVKINSFVQFNNKIKKLFSLSKIIKAKTFSHQQLSDLPEPVQRYFKYVLKEGQPYISYAAITHDGEFKTGLKKDWIKIKGEQYATTEKPGFIWKGSTAMFTAYDMYIADKGKLVVSLLSLINIVNANGAHYNQGELLRWLGESILYPTNLLPSDRLQWLTIDAKSAKLTFDYQELSLFFLISFNEIGEITEMETKRYMDETNLETWVIKCAEYTELNNLMVPSTFEVLWRLEKEDFPYARFNIKSILYNKPEKIKS